MGTGQKLLLLALAGALGTLCRYGTTLGMQKWTGGLFPWGTFAANVAGCLLFGFVVGLSEGWLGHHPEWRAILLIGFCGAFTTFSSLVFDTGMLWQGGGMLAAVLNMAGQTLLGFAALALGLVLAKTLF